ncbi:MAG: universal stress protein A [Halieaceae bacterium]|jgi:universal stress protein A
MANYDKILLAVDLSEDSGKIAERALAIAKNNDAELHVIHVIEPLSFAYGGDIPMDFSGIQDEIHQQAVQMLQKFAEKHGIDAERKHVVLGQPGVEIHALADETGADLIIVGSHGRHGLSLLMGSTANGVLHGAGCDVLAVRVGA